MRGSLPGGGAMFGGIARGSICGFIRGGTPPLRGDMLP
jgi:hypothetical protein